MRVLLSPSFWLSMFLSTFLTMCVIYLIKKLGTTYNIPIVSTVAEGV